MEIIKAKLKDKQGIKEIANLLKIETMSDNDFVWDKDDFIEKQINNGEYFIAIENNKIVGIMSFRQRQDIMYIETMAIIKEFQSKGIGTQFINYAKKYTLEKNLTTLRAYAFYQYNTQKFYLKNGFTLLNKHGQYGKEKYYRFEMKIN
jgi:N-acetylglutamate synthase-like GNAT family acetyltransferase